MIPKISVLAVFLGLSWLEVIHGAAYSKVYVQSGPDVVPVEYIKYGTPVVANPQIAQLTAAPVGSVLPLPNYVSPCVAPCILPGQNVGTVATAPSANIITYNSPRVPAVVVPANDDKSSYEYSYVVYDENTGDRKAQRELSDGSVVQGEYSFIQPDGYVREVKYTADDLTGFNAVVKNFLPESILASEKKPETKSNAFPPCPEVKSEAIKEEPKPDIVEPVKEETTPKETKPEEHPSHEDVQEPVHVELAVVPATEAVHAAEPVHTDTDEHIEEPTPEPTPDHAAETPQEHAAHKLSDEPANEHVTEPASELIKVPATESHVNEIDAIHTHEALQASAPVPETAKPEMTIPNGLVSYTDIIKCVQAAIANRDANGPKLNISPLTYILLPGNNKPC